MDQKEHDERQAVLGEASTWLRTPYLHEGYVKGHGVDCAYLLIGVFSNVGLIKSFRPEHYPRDWALNSDNERYVEQVLQFAGRVDEPKFGDVVMFRVGRCFSHAGIIVEWPRIIHASAYDKFVCYGDALKDHRLLTYRDGRPRETIFYTYWN